MSINIIVSKIVLWLKFHSWAVVLALLVGIISVAPQVIFSFSPEYKGIQMFGTDTEEYYISRINEVYDGHPGLGNVFLSEYEKKKPYMAPPLGEVLMAGLGKALWLDAVQVAIFAKFLFSGFLFLLSYSFVFAVFRSKNIAVVSASLIILGDNLLSNKADIIGLATLTTSSVDFLTYTRPVNPVISSLFFFGALYTLWSIAQGSQNKRSMGILLGALSALSIYISVYVWSFLIVAIVLSFAYCWWIKNESSRTFLIAIFIHAAVTIPFWLNSMWARMYQEYSDAASRLGLGASHAPIWGIWLALSTIIVFVLWPKRYSQAKWFFGVLTFSSWIVVNQQIVTGTILQPGHYHWYIVKPIVSILLAAVFVFFVEKMIKKAYAVTILTSALVVLFVYNAGLIQFSSYQAHLQEAIEKQRYATLVSYLREEYKTAQTIWSDVNTSLILPVYTVHNVPHFNTVTAFLNSKEYLIQRLFLEYRLRGIAPDEFVSTLKREKERVAGDVFGHYYHSPMWLPDEVVMLLENKYRKYYGILFETIFRYFDIDLIVEDRYDKGGVSYKFLPMLKKIEEIEDNFIVYKVNYTY